DRGTEERHGPGPHNAAYPYPAPVHHRAYPSPPGGQGRDHRQRPRHSARAAGHHLLSDGQRACRRHRPGPGHHPEHHQSAPGADRVRELSRPHRILDLPAAGTRSTLAMSRSETVWIVDDDRSILWVLEKALQQDGMATQSFDSADGVLSRLSRQQPDVIISDIRMPGTSGLDLLKQIREQYPRLPVIIMTAHSDLDSAVASYQGGAFEYLPKPFDVDGAVVLVKRANQHAQEQQHLQEPAHQHHTPEIIGEAPAMQEVFRAIGRLSHSNITVLINGESGTGKELVAHALHRHSPRARNPFIALNMAAIPHDLMESELFGHEKGAFTGAAMQRRGRFEQADGGTLFLDEIGDMPAETQTRLLRVLADSEFYRVGGHTPVKVDVRI